MGWPSCNGRRRRPRPRMCHLAVADASRRCHRCHVSGCARGIRAHGGVGRMALVIEGLTKRFGTVQALDGVSFAVEPGEILGFLGANGAGKTTTMRIVLGFLRADSGTVAWNDRDARAWPRRTWGYMPEERGLYLRMPVLDQLVFFGSLYGLSRATCAPRRARLAGSVPDRRACRAEGREPVQGQPAEGPVHRDRAPRPRRPAHGRAVRGSRPDQRGAAQVRLPRAS